MNKSYIVTCLYIFIGLAIFSCKKDGFLDATQSTTLTEQTVFADSAYTMNFLNGIYSNVGFSSSPLRFSTFFPSVTGCGLESSCDESEGYVSSQGFTNIQFASGTVNASIVSNDAWKNCYSEIRAVNMFLKHLPTFKFKDVLKTRTKAEAKFLRAWYYFILLEHYGGIPLVGDTLYTASDAIPQERSTFSACVNYITSECDTAAKYLDWAYSGLDYGRVNKAACLGLKARVLLYAASPLFNGSGIATGEPLKSITGYATYDKERWNLAQLAALDVINSKKYSLYVDNTTAPGYGFYHIFTVRENTTEYIFARMQGDNRDLENNWLPPSVHGKPITFPYLEMINAFGMSNGLPITDASSGYDTNFPYKNRDPRFNYSIVHDETMINRYPEMALLPINIVSGEDATHNGTLTGYYSNKMIDESLYNGLFTQLSHRCMPLIRYSEILLDYAEARNEYLDAPDDAVYAAVDSIRSRAGLNPFKLPPGLTQTQMREKIQQERRVELAFEGHRFWDVRRWKVASQTDNIMLHGTEVSNTNGEKAYQTFEVRKHNFVDRMYFWPIPQTEVAKSANLLQNPGY